MDVRNTLRDFVRTGVAPRPCSAPEAASLLRAAREQGVAGLWHEALGGASPPGLEELADVHRAWLARGLQQLALLQRTRALLGGAGLRSLALSGGAVAERLYATVGERPMSDVDLLVLDDWPAAVAVLRAHGFEPEERADHAWSFRAPDGPWCVELHRRLTSCGRLFPLDAEGLWARRHGDAPGPEDLLLQLALHATFQHGRVLSLIQHEDVRRLLERELLDEALLRRLARAQRAERALGAALDAAERVAGARLPEGLRRTYVDPLPSWLRRTDPLELVTPARPRLGRVRWQAAAGQRVALLTGTLRDGPLDEQGRHRHRPALGRAFSVARRTLRPAATPAGAGPARCPSLADAVLDDCLVGFDRVRLTVTGDCMRPALEPGDTVVLAPARTAPPRFGDVVLLRHAGGLRLHRLIWRPPLLAWRTKGDRAAFCDPALAPQDLVATVVDAHPHRARPRSSWSALRSLAAAVAVRLHLRSA